MKCPTGCSKGIGTGLVFISAEEPKAKGRTQALSRMTAWCVIDASGLINKFYEEVKGISMPEYKEILDEKQRGGVLITSTGPRR